MARVNKEIFIERANKKHNFKFDYSKVVYIDAKTYVTIICPIHGDFEQTPDAHYKAGCHFCGNGKRAEAYSKHCLKNRDWDFEQPEDYKMIPLTKGRFAKVDNEDFDTLKNINWSYVSSGYAYNRKIGLMHRFIMNCPENLLVDHKYHDTLDNRKSNLRVCTRGENTVNFKNGSKCRGVVKSKNKWNSRITYKNTFYYLGSFNTEKEASEAYNKKALEFFGEFAKLNTI